MAARRTNPTYDALIVGGGPAGLNAALVLARCRRSVLVVDAGRPRNYAARSMHNFLSRDGIDPAKFLDIGRREVEALGVEFRRGEVTDIQCRSDQFTAVIDRRRRVTARTVLLSTGVKDVLPSIKNAEAFYGVGVHHCPYCDAWQYRDRPIAAYGLNDAGVGIALNLRTWTNDIVVLTDGSSPTARALSKARRAGITIRTEPILRLESRRGRPAPTARDPLGRVLLKDRSAIQVEALFFNTDQAQRSQLPRRLGCRMNDNGGVLRDRRQRTGVPGLFLAGDASMDVQFVIVAAAEGAKAGVAMNEHLRGVDAQRDPRRAKPD